MKVKSESEVTQSHLTLSNLMDCSLPGSSVDGIFQARGLEWEAIAFSDSYTKYAQKAKGKPGQRLKEIRKTMHELNESINKEGTLIKQTPTGTVEKYDSS